MEWAVREKGDGDTGKKREKKERMGVVINRSQGRKGKLGIGTKEEGQVGNREKGNRGMFGE